MSAKAAFSAFLADQAISICVPADRSVRYSSETSQPMQLYGAGVGMLQQCSWLGTQAPGCHTNRSCYFSGSQKSWQFLAMIFKSQLALQKVLVVFKTKSNLDSSVLAAGELCKVFDLLALGLKRVYLRQWFLHYWKAMYRNLSATSRPLFSWLPSCSVLRWH